MTKKFHIPDDTTVVTSSYITKDGFPILEVSHEDDEEGGSLWQFHSGNGDYSMSKMELVRLDTILLIDPSISEVSDLPMGSTIRRESETAPWLIDD